MEKPVVLVANGQRPSHPKIIQIIKDAEKIICIDNGYEIAKDLKIIPSVIIGDLDSVNLNEVDQSVEIIKKEDQNLSDLEKALNYCIEKGFSKVYLLASTGLRDDHNLANLILIIDFIEKINVIILSDEYEIEAVKGKKEYKSKKNTQISIISINEGNKITTGGLKYNLKDEVLKSRSHGISNSTIEDNFFIECVKPILLFRKL